jgi:hypothetical protein
MERDLDLVRLILLKLEEHDDGLSYDDEVFSDYEKSVVVAHFKLMKEAGLIEAGFFSADGDPYWIGEAVRITWDGYDYLNSIRDDSVWRKVRDVVKSEVGSASFDTIKNVASSLTTALLAKALGI